MPSSRRNALGRLYHVTCCFGGVIHLRKSYFMEILFRLPHFKAYVNAPFLHKTNSKIYHHSWKQWQTCSCHNCLRNNTFSLQTLKNVEVKMHFPHYVFTSPPLLSATRTDLQHQWQSFTWASHIRRKKKFGEFQSCETPNF